MRRTAAACAHQVEFGSCSRFFGALARRVFPGHLPAKNLSARASHSRALGTVWQECNRSPSPPISHSAPLHRRRRLERSGAGRSRRASTTVGAASTTSIASVKLSARTTRFGLERSISLERAGECLAGRAAALAAHAVIGVARMRSLATPLPGACCRSLRRSRAHAEYRRARRCPCSARAARAGYAGTG